MRRLLAWILGGVLLLSLFLPSLVLLSRAAAYGDWAKTHNRERYRGTAITSVERRLYTAPAADLATSVRTLSRELTAELPDDTARLAAIYNWVCDNIAYDYDYFEGRTDTTGEAAGEVLALGRGVCVGYAELAAQLCRVAGIPCKIVNGYQLGAGEVWGEEHTALKPWEANHVWNEAYVGGRWVIFDTTWGSGNTYRDGVTTTGTTSPAQLDVTPETLADTRLNVDYISDGTCTYDQAVDGSLTLNAPLDEGLRSLNIPATVSGRPVVAVGMRAFYNCTALTSVTLPASVTTLGDMAFSYTGLTEMPDLSHVTAPGASLFAYCTALTTATLPAHWTEIPRGIFNKCANLESVTLPPVITAVGAQAFNGCEKIDSFPFADGLKTVGKEAFAGTALTAALLPNSVTTLGDGAFARCYELAAVTLPAGLTAIPGELLAGCSKVTEIDIPATVKTIGREAFRGTHMSSVTVPAGVTAIWDSAFYGCSLLKTVTLPDGITVIGERAFSGCGFEALELPEALQQIGDYAFKECRALKALTLPANLKQIGRGVFQYCSSLQSLAIPAGVTAIGEETFAYCSDLASLTVAEGNTAYAVKEGALYALGEPYTLLAYPAARPGTTFTVSAEVQKISALAFSNNRYLEEVRIEAVLKNNGYQAWGGNLFWGATALRAVHIADGNTDLSLGLFRGCASLEEVTLPEGLESLSLRSFSGCESLRALHIPASVKEIDTVAMSGTPLLSLQQFTVDEENEIYYAVDGVLFRREDKVLIWYPAGKTDTTYTVPAGTPAIEEYAFCNAEHLTGVHFPEELEYIGESAFDGCKGLTAVTFPERLQTLGWRAFARTGLSSITLPAGLVTFGWAFHETPWWNAQAEGPVYLGDALYGLKFSDEEWFEADEVVVREGTRVIADSFLSLCQGIKRLVIPSSVTHIHPDIAGGGPIIVGERGTAAEEYANLHGYTFVVRVGKEMGDVDGDGKITTTDARLTLQYAVGKVDVSALFLDVADVDGDGTYTTTDARLMLQYAVGKIKEFPVAKPDPILPKNYPLANLARGFLFSCRLVTKL